MSDSESKLQQQVLEAAAIDRSLAITGGSSKAFYGREIVGQTLSTRDHCGIVDYDPTELVITAKAGTRIADIVSLLGENQQMPGFEPPAFGENATLGGVVASGLSGPIRPFSGAVRDFVLGIKLLSGNGDIMQFGGRVMKNVAGFDVSRLMVGAMGVLGVILEVSMKVLPKPEAEMTVRIKQPNIQVAIQQMNQLCGKPWPVSAASWYEGEIWLRLSGTRLGIDHARSAIGGDVDPDGDQFWTQSREQTLPFFDGNEALFRTSVAPATPACDAHESVGASVLVEWAGGVRWSRVENGEFRNHDLDGHVTVFRGGNRKQEVFHPLAVPIMGIHQNLKNTFDPKRILNPGRLYADL